MEKTVRILSTISECKRNSEKTNENWHFQNIFVFIFRRNLLCCIWGSSHWDSFFFLWHHRWRQSSEAFAAKASTSILPSDDGEPPWVDVEFRIRGTTWRSTRSTRGVTADQDDAATSWIGRGQTWRFDSKQILFLLRYLVLSVKTVVNSNYSQTQL